MKRILLVALAVAFSCGTAEAISRYNSRSLSCAKARALVHRQGAVIFRYRSTRNPSLTLYDRFVAHGGHCAWGEVAAPKSIPPHPAAARCWPAASASTTVPSGATDLRFRPHGPDSGPALAS